jgi:integrase
VFTHFGRGWRGAFNDPVRAQNFHTNVWVLASEPRPRTRPDEAVQTHDLGRTNASWLIQGGVPLTVIQRHLGHESIQTTSDRYGHLDRKSSRVVADVVGKALKPKTAGTKRKSA